MYYSSSISTDSQRLITLLSSHPRHNQYNTNNHPAQRKEYTTSTIGSKSYKDALQHSFNVASRRVFFNPDMTYFLTFTYKDNVTDVDKVLQDIKIFIKSQKRKMSVLESNQLEESKNKSKVNKKRNIVIRPPSVGQSQRPARLQAWPNHGKDAETPTRDSIGDTPKYINPKYIFVLEKQKRGAIHVHMIANNFFYTYVNENGFLSLTDWAHGWTSVRKVQDFNKNFKPFLYLFKYMRKSERVGKSFVHSSRGLDNYESVSYDVINSDDWRLTHKEVREYTYINDTGKETTRKYYKNYYERGLNGDFSND